MKQIPTLLQPGRPERARGGATCLYWSAAAPPSREADVGGGGSKKDTRLRCSFVWGLSKGCWGLLDLGLSYGSVQVMTVLSRGTGYSSNNQGYIHKVRSFLTMQKNRGRTGRKRQRRKQYSSFSSNRGTIYFNLFFICIQGSNRIISNLAWDLLLVCAW